MALNRRYPHLKGKSFTRRYLIMVLIPVSLGPAYEGLSSCELTTLSLSLSHFFSTNSQVTTDCRWSIYSLVTLTLLKRYQFLALRRLLSRIIITFLAIFLKQLVNISSSPWHVQSRLGLVNTRLLPPDC